MLGLFIYLVMIMLPVLIPLGVTVTHAVGEFRTGRTGRTGRTARRSLPAMTRRMPALARA
jgi:hypothetical protein